MPHPFLVIILLFLLTRTVPAAGDGIIVVVSIPPQKYLAEMIGGDRIRVTTMLKPGHGPETYDPVPAQMALLSNAQIYFLIGVPFETKWRKKFSLQNEKMRMIETCRYCMIEGRDPHGWTNPVNAIRISEQIRTALIEADPQGITVYENNFKTLVEKLEQLDHEIGTKLKDRHTDYFISSHDAWSCFAGRYGLKQLALESGGREKGPRGIAELVEIAREEKIKILFIQEQHPTGPAYTLADELGARPVVIDPLAENYIENMRQVTALISEAIR